MVVGEGSSSAADAPSATRRATSAAHESSIMAESASSCAMQNESECSRTHSAPTVFAACSTDFLRPCSARSDLMPVAKPLVRPPRSCSSGYDGLGGRREASEPSSCRIRLTNLLRMKKQRAATVSTHSASIGPPWRAGSKKTSSDEEKRVKRSHTTAACRCPSASPIASHRSRCQAASSSSSNRVVRLAVYSAIRGSTMPYTSARRGRPRAT
mmetsp:Transcript_2664/g.8731  ORF Transcript_2664/g.8731 Transcript_2664/m.8731 type:complete len:212 (-) Transcript_2664:465-1100(-)